MKGGGTVEKEGPWDTLSQKALRMASQSCAKARQVAVAVLSWGNNPSHFSLLRFSTRATAKGLVGVGGGNCWNPLDCPQAQAQEQ